MGSRFFHRYRLACYQVAARQVAADSGETPLAKGPSFKFKCHPATTLPGFHRRNHSRAIRMQKVSVVAVVFALDANFDNVNRRLLRQTDLTAQPKCD